MALIIEDGTGKTDSQSYASEAELAAYAALRGVTVTGTDTELLIKAMDYLETQSFKGYKYTDDQALQWPRGSVYLYGYYIDVDTIPQLLKDAQIEFALGIDAGNNPTATLGRATKSEKVGDIEVEYMAGARDTTYLVAAESKLSELLAPGSGGFSTVAIRG